MLCHVVHYQSGDESSWGVLYRERVYTLVDSYPTTRDFLARGRPAAYALLAALDSGEHPAAGVAPEHLTLLSPVTDDARVLCQGVNYRRHMQECGMDPDARDFNLFFTKSGASISGPRGTVVRPSHVRLLDYEVELGLVLHGEVREPTEVAHADLHRHVAGVVIGNDISARDVQIPQGQFFKGKSYRGFCPVGPVLCLLEAEDMHYLDDLVLECRVNGATRQEDSTGNMVYKPAETLTELSQIADLLPGDLVLTGTPHGCALQVPKLNPLQKTVAALLPERRKWASFVERQAASGRYLEPGDVMTLTIRSGDGSLDLGTQQTTVAG